MTFLGYTINLQMRLKYVFFFSKFFRFFIYQKLSTFGLYIYNIIYIYILYSKIFSRIINPVFHDLTDNTVRGDILLIAHIFSRPCGARKKITRLGKISVRRCTYYCLKTIPYCD